jgi:hypothetical protein
MCKADFFTNSINGMMFKGTMLGRWNIFFLSTACVFLPLLGYFSWQKADKLQQELSAKSLSEVKSEVGQRNYLEWLMTRNPQTGKIPQGIYQREQLFAKGIPTVEAFNRVNKSPRLLSEQWKQRGPINRGGRTRALAIDISNESRILAGGVTNGMWLSTDAGASWKRTTVLGAHPSVSAVAQDTRAGKTNVWYYTSGEHSSSAGGGSASYNGDGVFKSIDGGLTWSVLPSTANGSPQTKYPFSHTWNIAIDPSSADKDIVYVAAASSIQRSTDGGTTWTAVLQVSDAEYTDVAVTSTGVVYATINGTNGGIFRSTNGTDWNKIAPAGFPTELKRITIGVAPSNQNIVYFFGETPNAGKKTTEKGEWHSLYKYTYKSGDGSGDGGTWADNSTNVPLIGGKVGDYSSQNSYDIFISVSPADPNLVFIGGTNLYRSTDGFSSSTSTSWVAGYSKANDISIYENHHPDLHANLFLPSNPKVMYSGHDGGISRTDDCTADEIKWVDVSRGYITSQFYAIAIDKKTSGSQVIVGGLQDNGTYATNSGDVNVPWTSVYSGDGGFAEYVDTAMVFVSSQNGDVVRNSANAGEIAPPAGATGMLFINPFTLDATDNKIMFYPAGTSMWRTLDATSVSKNSGWEKLTATETDATITAVATSTKPEHILFYGTGNGKVFKAENSNATLNVKEITGSNFPKDGYVSCVTADPTNADNIYVVFSNYEVLSLFATTDGGTTWKAISGNLEQNPDGSGNGPSCRWITVLPYNGKTMLFVGTSTGLYSTSTVDGMSTVWAQEGANTIGNIVITMVLSRPADGMIVAATHAGGVFSAIAGAPVSVGEESVNQTIHFVNNYPEPFANTTTIRYNLDKAQQVKMSIHDIQGREVSVPLSRFEQQGEHEVVFDASTLSSGRYMVHLSSGNNHQTRMITVSK